jgi:hypothetical protein
MGLDELIAQMTNPQEFTRLCNSVFTDIYGDAFQVIDGTRGDNGNDGYVASERRILAIYCPIKPEQKTDAGYLDKIKSDLAKAVALKREKKYEIETWTFVTPRKLGDDVVAKMRSLATEAGISATHREGTFLANELYRRGHLLKGFPGLQFIDLGAKLDQLTQALAKKYQASPGGPEPAPSPVSTPAVNDELSEARVRQLAQRLPTVEGKAELKAIAYKTNDPVVEINAILCLFRWFDPADDARDELIAFATRGINLAKRCSLNDAEAWLHANKGAMHLWDFTTDFVESRLTNMIYATMGLEIPPLEQAQRQLTRLRKLEENWKTEISAAADALKQSGDPDAVAGVLQLLGISMGQLALMYKQVGEGANASLYLGECKKLLMTAKDLCAAIGDELGAANAVFNLANQVRWHDATAEALALVKSTIPLAEKHRDRLLLQKAKWLQHTLETGKIPNYRGGERRDLTADPPAPLTD